MAKQGFVRDGKAIARILHNDPGLQAAVNEAAQRILDQTNDPDCFLSDGYHTDRYVRSVMVPAHKQAKDGTGTRAANAARNG